MQVCGIDLEAHRAPHHRPDTEYPGRDRGIRLCQGVGQRHHPEIVTGVRPERPGPQADQGSGAGGGIEGDLAITASPKGDPWCTRDGPHRVGAAHRGGVTEHRPVECVEDFGGIGGGFDQHCTSCTSGERGEPAGQRASPCPTARRLIEPVGDFGSHGGQRTRSESDVNASSSSQTKGATSDVGPPHERRRRSAVRVGGGAAPGIEALGTMDSAGRAS